MAFFQLKTPRDMLEKTKREHARLRGSFDIDNVFNFFVSAYHISDYIEKTDAVPQAVREKFLKDADMQICRDLCNKGKHMRLTYKKRTDKKHTDPQTAIWDGCLDGAPLDALPLDGGNKWVVFIGDKHFNVEYLAERVLRKWEAFFVQHGL